LNPDDVSLRHLLAYSKYKDDYFEWETQIIQTAIGEMLDDNT